MANTRYRKSPLHMLADVLMVLMWASMIPALMWLGALAGF